jgi:hypothetical protein
MEGKWEEEKFQILRLRQFCIQQGAMLFRPGCLLYSTFSLIRATQFLEGATTLSVDEAVPKRRGTDLSRWMKRRPVLTDMVA